jgi:hypothetical protein
MSKAVLIALLLAAFVVVAIAVPMIWATLGGARG